MTKEICKTETAERKCLNETGIHMSQDCGKTFITMRKTPFRTAGMRFPHIRRGCVIVRKRLFRIPEKALPRGWEKPYGATEEANPLYDKRLQKPSQTRVFASEHALASNDGTLAELTQTQYEYIFTFCAYSCRRPTGFRERPSSTLLRQHPYAHGRQTMSWDAHGGQREWALTLFYKCKHMSYIVNVFWRKKYFSYLCT